MLGDTAPAAALVGNGKNWMDPIWAYLTNQATLVDDTNMERTSRKAMSYQMVAVSSTNKDEMGFFSNVSHRPRALICSMTSTEVSMGPMPLTECWLGKPFDKVSTGQQRLKMPLSWFERVSLVSFLNDRPTSHLKR